MVEDYSAFGREEADSGESRFGEVRAAPEKIRGNDQGDLLEVTHDSRAAKPSLLTPVPAGQIRLAANSRCSTGAPSTACIQPASTLLAP